MSNACSFDPHEKQDAFKYGMCYLVWLFPLPLEKLNRTIHVSQLQLNSYTWNGSFEWSFITLERFLM